LVPVPTACHPGTLETTLAWSLSGVTPSFLTATGPKREALSNGRLQPAIIIEAGLDSSNSEWVAVIQMIASRARAYAYDRAGYGLSQRSPTLEYSAQTRIHELSRLLQVTGIGPPYILVGHSYGGILVKEFLLQHHEKVAEICGLSLVKETSAS
jgi:Predicted hydrolases or acyltransferases (alpha/beta hydrolase superfamily)